MIEQTPEERINMLRRCLHIHSVMYYYLHTSIVPDATFDGWANELVELHAAHPDLVHKGYSPGLFADWTGDTGMHLTVTEETIAKAQWLLDYQPKT